MATPPGVSRKDFSTALGAFRSAVGDEWVLISEEDLAPYRDSYSPMKGEESEIVASAAVAPSSAEQVQAVLRIANQYKIPIYPISTGKNLGYGGAAPVLSGSVVLDLKRMNKIIEVNEVNAYALVEPGVTYFDLFRYIRERKLKLWIDVPDPGWGSLIGNALDHGAGYTAEPFRDHFDAHCGMEVVLADGTIVRTGSGAVPNSKTWQQFKYGVGPFVDGIFSQSNFGVVTKMGFYLMPEPEAYKTGMVAAPRYKDLDLFVETLARLKNSGVVNTFTRLLSPILDPRDRVIDPELKALIDRPGGYDPDALQAYAESKKSYFWSAPITLFGPKEVIEAQWAHIKRAFGKIPGATFEEDPAVDLPLSDAQIEALDNRAALGIPSLGVFASYARSELNPSPAAGHLWLTSVIPMTGEAVLEAHRVFSEAFREWGITPLGFHLPQSYHPRTFVVIHGFPVTDDQEVNRKNRESFRKMIKLAADHGWAEYRTHSAFMDDVMATYSYNDNALLRLHETIKDGLDPNGILSAGRYGIWPKPMRKARKS